MKKEDIFLFLEIEIFYIKIVRLRAFFHHTKRYPYITKHPVYRGVLPPNNMLTTSWSQWAISWSQWAICHGVLAMTGNVSIAVKPISKGYETPGMIERLASTKIFRMDSKGMLPTLCRYYTVNAKMKCD